MDHGCFATNFTKTAKQRSIPDDILRVIFLSSTYKLRGITNLILKRASCLVKHKQVLMYIRRCTYFYVRIQFLGISRFTFYREFRKGSDCLKKWIKFIDCYLSYLSHLTYAAIFPMLPFCLCCHVTYAAILSMLSSVLLYC